jgi:hypothetical protein
MHFALLTHNAANVSKGLLGAHNLLLLLLLPSV